MATAMVVWASNSPQTIGMPKEVEHKYKQSTKIISEASI
jgi:uncharacterized protein YbaP (TraB family)